METVTVTITIDWNCEMSINVAEQAKAKLENAGWTLVNSFGGMNKSVLIYANI
jgi:hypothetical protein